ncbi:MAG: alpha/beta hydrolase [Deltaproteobacteria bacterium]|nr:alpha/beta hydrolase [Deltaproteobacteria bacterium]
MATTQLYYATNRHYRGRDRWKPTGYGPESSEDGTENLRFGLVTIRYDHATVAGYLADDCGFGAGNGEKLSRYFYGQRSKATINAFAEELSKEANESDQPRGKLGSSRAFSELQAKMNRGDHVLIFVHGPNMNWWEAVASALSLQCMLNRHCGGEASPHQSPRVHVVLFAWPSGDRKIPRWSYFSDRSDAKLSGYALGRGLLKLRDYLLHARRLARQKGEPPCGRSIHLLCHSMGNYVLQNALERTAKFSVGGRLPRIFQQIFLCAADVSADVFQPGEPFHRLAEMAEAVTIYHNRRDPTLPHSDYAKGATARLGWDGAEWPAYLPDRAHQVDCSRLVSGVIEHSYYHCGAVNDDIRQTIEGMPRTRATTPANPPVTGGRMSGVLQIDRERRPEVLSRSRPHGSRARCRWCQPVRRACRAGTA